MDVVDVRSRRNGEMPTEEEEVTKHASSLSIKVLATDLCRCYLASSPLAAVGEARDHEKTRRNVLSHLVTECGVNEEAMSHAISNYQAKGRSIQARAKLRDACAPKYEAIFHRLLSESDRALGMRFLVELRQDVMTVSRSEEMEGTAEPNRIAHLKQLDTDLKVLLSTWFSSGILELRRITYEDTPAAIIEKIATKEAVHPLKSLNDLKIRLGPSRRCFAFFHPSLPDEPLVFVHVALSQLLPASMKELDELTATGEASTKDTPRVATFYSITATQKGLSGVDLGNFLIKNVVQVLKAEFPRMETFATLSPIPRFRKWLQEKLQMHGKASKFSGYSMIGQTDKYNLASVLKCKNPDDVPEALVRTLETNWFKDDDDDDDDDKLTEALRPVLMKLAARYLAVEKHRGKPLDGVAKFHISNGAEMYRLNYLADVSRKGMHNSAGIMINYRYQLENIEANQADYETFKHITVCDGVSAWLE